MSTENIINQAINFLSKGEYEKAEPLFREVLTLNPKEAEALWALGVIALSKGAGEVAFSFLSKAYQQAPKEEKYGFTLAISLQNQGMDKEAIPFYKKYPSLPEAWINRGLIARKNGEKKEALKDFQKALSLAPTHEKALIQLALLKREEEAFEEALDILETLPATGEALYQKATTCRLMKDYETAKILYNQLLKEDFIEPHFYDSYGIALEEAGDYEEALRMYEKAFEKDAYFAQALFHQGNVLRKLKKPSKAIDTYRRALILSKEDAAIYHNLGMLLSEEGLYEEALENYRKAILINPDQVETLYNLADLLEKVDENEEAAGLYLKILALLHQHSLKGMRWAEVRLSTVLSRIKNKEIAEGFLKTWLKNFPKSKMAQGMQKILKEEGLLSEFVECYYDAFADSYEDKMKELACQVPVLLKEVLASKRFDKALDLGCGTGLLVDEIFSIASDWTGVDISSKMIQKAKEKGKYTTLIESDMVSFLEKEERTYNLIASSEGISFISEIESLFAQIYARLSSKGAFVFSFEESEEGKDFTLLPSGRYALSEKFLRSLLEKNGFSKITLYKKVLRKEGNGQCLGFIVEADKA
ncbi:MAG: tetratricopeptide repeat protein [Alphaproteobacteria bacterium]|nr:tetratricopeptide repeat protein [Alphaproteobacteria bacterium]